MCTVFTVTGATVPKSRVAPVAPVTKNIGQRRFSAGKKINTVLMHISEVDTAILGGKSLLLSTLLFLEYHPTKNVPLFNLNVPTLSRA